MSVPFDITGVLNLPGADGLPPQPLPFVGSGVYTSKAEFDFTFADALTQAVPFGTIPEAGAKVLLLLVSRTVGAAVISVNINGGEGVFELAPGGFLAYFSPTPAEGITSMSFTATAPGRVQVWILG